MHQLSRLGAQVGMSLWHTVHPDMHAAPILLVTAADHQYASKIHLEAHMPVCKYWKKTGSAGHTLSCITCAYILAC